MSNNFESHFKWSDHSEKTNEKIASMETNEKIALIIPESNLMGRMLSFDHSNQFFPLPFEKHTKVEN